MTLKHFLEELWRQENLKVALCLYEDFDEMFSAIYNIQIGNDTVGNVSDEIICSFDPTITDCSISTFLNEQLITSEVKAFTIAGEYLFVWVEEVDAVEL